MNDGMMRGGGGGSKIWNGNWKQKRGQIVEGYVHV